MARAQGRGLREAGGEMGGVQNFKNECLHTNKEPATEDKAKLSAGKHLFVLYVHVIEQAPRYSSEAG